MKLILKGILAINLSMIVLSFLNKNQIDDDLINFIEEYLEENNYELNSAKARSMLDLKKFSFFTDGYLECYGLNGGIDVYTEKFQNVEFEINDMRIDSNDTEMNWSDKFLARVNRNGKNLIMMSDIIMVHKDTYIIKFLSDRRTWHLFIFKDEVEKFQSCTLTSSARH